VGVGMAKGRDFLGESTKEESPIERRRTLKMADTLC
jgi:hypothetical protein